MKKTWVALAMALGSMLVVSNTTAQTRASFDESIEATLPPELEAWVPWVLAEIGQEACPEVNGARSCAWPGALKLDLDNTGGQFEERVVSSAKAWHVLPGQRGAWPKNVTVDGRDWPVLERDQVPAVELGAGSHEIRGRFAWDRVPETLHVGATTAFLSVRLSGKDVPLIKREAGTIWLKGLATELDPTSTKEQVEMQVFRQLRDGVPLQVETLLVFQVSGRSRELALDAPLLAGTVPLSVSGDLAVALEPNGTLRAQLVPGHHEVRLLARTVDMPAVIKNQVRAAPWPQQEFWTWRPHTALRSVEISGAPSVDASRTSLPADWRNDSVYVLGPQDALKLTTTRRAQEQVPENRLQLDREYWLDEAASHFTVRDTLSGEMHQRWRLDLQRGELGQVQLSSQGQVITLASPHSQARRGVEVRDNQLSLMAVSRIPRTSRLPAVGWSEDVDRLSTTVHLPPGWDLFAATGVDDASESWLSRWDLFSVFYVLVMTLAVARLIHVPAGAVAAGALILSHGEVESPEYIWLPLIVFGALVVLIEPGRFQRLLRLGFYGTALVLWIVFVSFAVRQVRAALYPHLDSHFSSGFEFNAQEEKASPVMPPSSPGAPSQALETDASSPRPEESLEEGGSSSPSAGPRVKLGRAGGGAMGRARDGLDYDYQSQKQFKPDAIVQSGPGIPETAGRSWQLNWSGPVAKDHELSLYLISPSVNRLLTVLRLVLLGALGWLIWRRVHQRPRPSEGTVGAPSASAAALILLGLCLLPANAHAAEVSDARLAQLKERLNKAPSCGPQCLSANFLEVEVADQLLVRAHVHAAARSAYKLPGPAVAFSAVELSENGRPLSAVRLEADGSYYVLLERGVHEIELRARLVSDRTTLDVGTPPERVQVRAEGWTVAGINELGRVEGGTLTLQRAVERTSETTGTPDALKSQIAVPPFFSVRRSISLFVTGQVITHIERLSDATQPEVLQVPLLAGERLTTPGIQVKGDVAIVPFPSESTSQVLNSTLILPKDDQKFELSLLAPTLGGTTETWSLQCGVVWHCSTTGITPTSHLSEGHSLWTFHPWPGEKLAFTALPPAPAPGAFLTVQQATLSLNPGIRLMRSELQLAIQTSRAVVHTVTIPPDAKLDTVQVDGVAQSVKADQGQVRVSLSPGLRQVTVIWQQNQGLSVLFRSPQVDVGGAGVNFRTMLDLPEKRWLLLAGGPSQGPAILVWGYLVLIVCAAMVLARMPFAPLSVSQWLLLGLGLTQIPSGAALFVAGWFFAVGSRKKWPRWGRFRHNFLQLALVFYTLAFLSTLTVAVYEGLVSSPDMDVTGAGSYGTHLVWVSDRSVGSFAPVWCLSLSVWFWRAFMLAWALWLSKALLGWLKWAWGELNSGQFWAPKPPTSPAARAHPSEQPRHSEQPSPSEQPRHPESQDGPEGEVV